VHFCKETGLVSDAYNIDGSNHPEPEPLEILTLPLDAWHRAQGGRMVEFAGYHMPVQYEGILAEHLWTREHAGLFDVSHMGQLYLSGEGLDAALEALLPIDLATLAIGRQRYSLLLNEGGGILDDLMVTRWKSGLYLVVNGATKWDDIAHLRMNLPDEITLTHLEDSALLALQGPKAADALASLAITPAQPQIIPPQHLAFMHTGPYLWNGIDIHISRSGYTGEDGYEIALPAEHAAAFADALTAHASVKPIGLGARDSLRLEAGLPLYGHDMNEDIDPVSAGLTFGINKRRRADGGFPGAPRILAALAQGTATTRIGLALEGRQAAREGAEIYHGEIKIGQVTSGGFAPSLGYPIAMGDVITSFAATGTQLHIDIRGKKLPATVTKMPFVPHRYVRKGAAQ
jgi:aminomethyltransferase